MSQGADDLQLLRDMLEHFKSAPPIYQPSPFWTTLVAGHIDRLKTWGMENFKRTVNTQYFNWELPSIFMHQMVPVCWHWLFHPDRAIFTTEFTGWDRPKGQWIASFGAVGARIYKLYVGLLAHFVSRHDPQRLLQTLVEPTEGNPWRIRFKNNWISQDLCNSAHEYYSCWDWST